LPMFSNSGSPRMTVDQMRFTIRSHWAAQTSSAAATAPVDLGPMPKWNLSDLYPAPDSPEIERDFATAAAEAKRLRETYQGKLVAMGRDGAALAEAVQAYEKLADLMGRLGSYAGLL